MAKTRGAQRWKHSDDILREVLSIEAQLDSAHQVFLQNHFDEKKPKEVIEKTKIIDRKIVRALGHARSLIARSGHKQKCLSRFCTPAPNQESKCPICGKRLILNYRKKPMPHECLVACVDDREMAKK